MEKQYILTEQEKEEYDDLRRDYSKQWENAKKEIPKIERFGLAFLVGLIAYFVGIMTGIVLFP